MKKPLADRNLPPELLQRLLKKLNEKLKPLGDKRLQELLNPPATPPVK